MCILKAQEPPRLRKEECCTTGFLHLWRCVAVGCAPVFSLLCTKEAAALNHSIQKNKVSQPLVESEVSCSGLVWQLRKEFVISNAKTVAKMPEGPARS